MKLPGGERAIIDRRKLVDYCLSMQHEEGCHKARLFASILGITANDADELMDALQKAAASGEAVPGHQDKYGQRYVVDFPFAGLSGAATIRSAWIIPTSEAVPRLVTCYIL